MVGQAGHGARDRDLMDIVTRCDRQFKAQLAWLRMRMRAAAPQTLLVGELNLSAFHELRCVTQSA
jgi:hypothetical protein